VEQKVTSVEARRSWRAIMRRWGSPAPSPSAGEIDQASRFGLRLRPDPDRLSVCRYADFHRLGIERRRAEALLMACRRASTLEALSHLPLAAARAALESLPGIGPWTSSSVLQQTFGDPDIVIVGDYHLPNTVSWNLAHEARADDARMLELLEPFTGHRGRVVRLLGQAGQHAPARGPKRRIRSIANI
jgi:3-methyladenine DNA glycosylase/8-oxoguanine DNA glycosylase